tara:strand:+ start:1029 stop:1256 length:228 start_codon:yes stop_codon:yes gene_type:complete
MYQFQSKNLNKVLQETADELGLTYEDVYRIFVTPYIELKRMAKQIEPEKLIIREFLTFEPNATNLKKNNETKTRT